MTYIKLEDDMRLVVTKAEPIYRGENLNKKITFLLPIKVGNVDVKAATVFLTYVRGDGKPDIVILEPESPMYDTYHYKYVLPVTCKLSRYPGEVRMWLQFLSGDADNPEISKSGDCVIRITNSDSLDDCLGDHQISALYQLKLKVDEMASGSGGSGNSGNSGNTGNNGGSEDVTPDNPDDEEGFPAIEF